METKVFSEDNVTVLIVDDQPQNRKLIARYVFEEGANCLEAKNGTEAIELARNESPSLILLDISMPGIDGFETCRELKNLPETTKIPIIFITCKNATEDIVHGFDLGASDYIVKPFKPKELVARMRAHLTIKIAGELLNQKNNELQRVNDELVESRKMIYDDAGKLLALNQKMADSEEKFSKAFDLNPSLMAIVSIGDYKYIDANESFLKALNFEKFEIVGNLFQDSNIFADKTFYAKLSALLSEDRRVKNHPIELITKKQKRLYCLLSAEIINMNFRECFLVVCQDVTELKEAQDELRLLNKELEDRVEERTRLLQEEVEVRRSAEEALRMSEKLKDAILTGMKGVLLEYVDADLNVIWTNSVGGAAPNDDSNAPVPHCFSTLVDCSQECPGCALKKSLRSGRREEGEIDLPDGRSFILVSNPILDEKGKAISFVHSGYDVTVLKNAQKEILDAKEKAEEVSRFKSMLLSNLKHELRTPLNGILGFSDILYDELENKEYKDMANLIRYSGQRLLNTIESILHLSKVESNLIKLQLEPIHLSQFMKFQLAKYLHPAEERGLAFEYVRKDYKVYANLDKFLLMQSINYLVDNAIKFTHAGFVRVIVDTEIIDNKKYAVIHVQDSGIGIEEGKMMRIFDDFYQAEETLARQYEGSGVGLSLAKKMVELMGGSIRVESEVGKGSTFSINFPALEMF